MRSALLWLPAFSLALVPLTLPTTGPRPTAARVVVVKMIDVSLTAFKFDPAAVTVSPGKTPHNVGMKGPFTVQAK